MSTRDKGTSEENDVYNHEADGFITEVSRRRLIAGGGALFVSDGQESWQLCADIFGSTLHRVAFPVAA